LKKLLEYDNRYDDNQNFAPFSGAYNKNDDDPLIRPVKGVDFYQSGKLVRGGEFSTDKNRLSPHKNRGL